MEYPVILGADCTARRTIFTLWAPDCDAVRINLYTAGSEEEAPRSYAHYRLQKGEDGIFSFTAHGDLHGIYYDYLLRFPDASECTSADPWAKACGLNGLRSMCVDLSRTDPDGWKADRAPAAIAAPVVYETHVKDFSAGPGSGVRAAWQGKYLGFTEEGTSCDGAPTCLAHLKALGVTHVQLQPISDFASVREDKPGDYNWGYDIMNYNVPEGSYATDAAHGEVRIRECKQMVQALHSAGLRVVMDVVYNHTYHRHSWLDRTAPGRYYRHAADGSHLNGSGCGNETASETPAFRNYMVQSVLYWAKEYHIDGFRFDLMGVHDVETMNIIRGELDNLPGGMEILLYGEPWAGGTIALKEPYVPASKQNARMLHPRIGIFSDTTRDTLMGSPFDAREPGYVSGKTDAATTARLRSCLTGLCGHGTDAELLSPTQAVHYVSCHDNYTLWDHLVLQSGSDDFAAEPEMLLRRMKLVSGICLCCPGIGFIQEGEELCRSKGGDSNSYQGPTAVNAIDWRRAAAHTDLTAWYRGLIGLRREMMPELTPASAAAAEFLPAPEGCLCLLRKVKAGSRFGTYLIYINASDRAHAFTAHNGIWTMLCDGVRSDLWRDADGQAENPFVVPAGSIVILGR